MGGGFIQLAAYGAQDLYLTGNPQISYFIMVYKRYTNFAIENCRQYFTGEANFGKKVYCQIERIGDLMSETFLVIKLPSLEPLFRCTNSLLFLSLLALRANLVVAWRMRSKSSC